VLYNMWRIKTPSRYFASRHSEFQTNRTIVLISRSNVTVTPLPAIPQTYTRSTLSHSTQSMEPSARQAQTEHSTSGTKTPNTDSKVIPQLEVRFQQQHLIKQETSLRTQSAMTGARDMQPTRHSTQIKSCCMVS
jgi:hypothetical protein